MQPTEREDIKAWFREAYKRRHPEVDFEAYDRECAEADRLYAGVDPLRRHYWANEWVKFAVNHGILAKPGACESCHEPARVTQVDGRTMTVPGREVVPKRKVHARSLLQAHHPDYRDLNRVEWLCDRCHSPMLPLHVLNPDGWDGERQAYLLLRAKHGAPVRQRRK